MNDRIKKLRERLRTTEYPICIEKARLVMEAYEKYDGDPTILRRAKATANYLDKKTVFIDDDELIVGNVASKPLGMEAGSLGPTWSKEDIADLKNAGISITQEDEAELRAMDTYWRDKGRTVEERQGRFYDDKRLWPFIQAGILIPPWKKKNEGRGFGAAGVGWGLGSGQTLIVVDYEKVIKEGLNSIISDAQKELENLKYIDAEACKKADFLMSVIISLSAVVRLANRFGDLAEKMAIETKSPARRKELEKIAETCRRVPGNPARTFYEAMQSFWFAWMMIADGTAPGGRFDQFMYPYYANDKKKNIITDDEVLELLECLRIKIMQYNFVGGGKQQRAKWAGLARWHNWVIGGVTPDGKDSSNELSYLILDAAMDLQTPHHTITLRVHEGTPEALMLKALEVVRTGIGMPAFVGDKSYIEYLVGQGVSLEDARNYALAGCLDVNVPGKSRISAFGMFNVPLVFEITLNNGVETHTGKQLGLQTGEFTSFVTYEDFLEAFKKQLAYFMGLTAEEHNILLQAQKELFPDPVHSALMFDSIKVGKDILDRTMPFENGSALNCVGMINVADSLAAVKKLVFDDKKITAAELLSALQSNWEGDRNSEIKKMCLAVPKYGNGDAYVDNIASDLYSFWAKTALIFPTIYGGTNKPTGISITAHAPGGALTGATPDGRSAGEAFADGTMSPVQGKDTNGPTAVIRSAIKIDQTKFQATLLNMKFHPSALQTKDELTKLADLIKTYFEYGGKHIQFNVVNKETLLDAQTHPEKHRDLIVRVAGYSAYFVNLTPAVQNEIIARSEQCLQ